MYAVVGRIKEIKPWRFMEKDDLFGVQFRGSEKLGYVSIMGLLGEHLVVTVYLGADALKTFFEIQDSPLDLRIADRVLEMCLLMLSFEDRDEFEPLELELIRELGLKFRGWLAWPLFLSYLPGYAPRHLDAGEVERLTVVLEQTADVAEHIKDNPDLIP